MSRRLSHIAFVLASASARAWEALINACRTAVAGQPDNYRPEAHYMRGPGPKWRAKNAKMSARR
jgi:hypothetical protein